VFCDDNAGADCCGLALLATLGLLTASGLAADCGCGLVAGLLSDGDAASAIGAAPVDCFACGIVALAVSTFC